MALFASYVPCIPSIPKNCGSLPGNAPRPCKVDVIGKFVTRVNSVKASEAFVPALITPPPEYMIGFFDLTIISTAFSISVSSALTFGL